jgi:hypothetical protein
MFLSNGNRKKMGIYILFTNSEYGEKLGDEVWNYFEKERE